MSFILDALKKSESERQRQSGPALLEMRVVRPSRALPAWAMVVGALLVVSVAVLAWIALRPAAPRSDAAPQLAAGAVQRPAAGAIEQSRSTGTSSGAVAGVQAGTADEAVAPGTAAASPAVPAGDVDVDAEAPANPADNAPAVSANSGSPPAAPAQGNLQTYAALSGTVPELRLDLHVYAQNPADRYAFINMRKVREGDTTPEGVQVRQITRDGVVLEYQGSEFLLGR